MLKPVRLVRYASAVIVALMLAFASAAPARADANADACFNTVAGAIVTVVDAAANLAAFAAHPECDALLSPPVDILFGGVTAVVTAADIAGAFGGKDYNSCANAIDSVLVSAITEALAAAIDGNSPLSPVLAALDDDVKNQIKQIAVDIATDKTVIGPMKDVLSDIPVVGQAIDMLPCACRLATAVIDGINDVKKMGSDAGDCAEFAVSCLYSPLGCLGSLFESGLDAVEDLAEAAWDVLTSAWDWVGCAFRELCPWCDNCPPPPSKPTVVDCAGGATLSGDVRDVGNGGKVSVSSNQVCSCPPTMNWQNNGGTWSCVCSRAGEIQVAHGICQCSPGQAVRDGFCQSCPEGTIAKYGTCVCPIVGEVLVNNVCQCPDGQQLAGNRCVTPCADQTQVLLANGKCCPPNKVSSCGVCCPSKQEPDIRSGSCVDVSWRQPPRATVPNFTPIPPPTSSPPNIP
jgi:hypothetical protein